jgi:glutamine synthetase
VYHPGKERATRAELRCPDPSCNPYLTFAALLHAGLEGIEKGYELPPPIDRNLYDLSEEERQEMGVNHLPETLGEAVEEMAQSEVVEKALGEHIFTRYVDLKREEWLDYRVQVTPWELQQYLAVT